MPPQLIAIPKAIDDVNKLRRPMAKPLLAVESDSFFMRKHP